MSIVIASLYPDLLGTYGDGGNVITLRHRAALRDLATEVLVVQPGDPVPDQADIYVLGGGEDTAQVAACEALRADGTLRSAAERGAPILAICAGYQFLGTVFPDATGSPAPGLGLIDIATTRLPSRAVGELAAAPAPGATGLLARDRFTGYENHAGGTARGPGVEPLATVLAGVGNGDGTEGAVQGHVIGTYLHGPCLVRNPDIADQLLEWAYGSPLAPVDEPEVAALRAERFRTVLRG
ncbi:MAG: glutamine amidotransferase [Candidatus Nanopelagicales bacterium]